MRNAWHGTGVIVLLLLAGLPAMTAGPVSPFDLGNRHYIRSDWSLAIKDYERELKERPAGVWAADSQYLIGDCYARLGQEERAVTAYRRTADRYAKSGRSAEALLAIARIRTEGAKWAEAIEALKQLIHAGRKPSLLPGAHYALANLYCEPANPAKDFSQARWHFAHVTQTYPKTNLAIASRLGVGQCFLAQGNPNEAVATAEAVLREYPNSSWSAAARALLATSYATLGDWNRASQEYQVVFDPSNVINVTRSQQAAPAFWNSNTMQNGANFLQPPSAALRVTADSMQYSTSHNKVIYTGNVRITRGALTVTADRGEAAVQRRVVTCQGTVRLTDQRGAVITGDALEINFTDGRATMRGDAKAVTTVAGRTRTETAREIVFSPDTGTYRLVP